MIPLYLDEDCMDRELVTALRARGADVTTAADAEMLGRSDADHLDYATSQGRVLYTFNRGDFYRLHTRYLTESKSHAGIILVPQQRYSIGEQMRQLLELIATKSAEEMRSRCGIPQRIKLWSRHWLPISVQPVAIAAEPGGSNTSFHSRW